MKKSEIVYAAIMAICAGVIFTITATLINMVMG